MPTPDDAAPATREELIAMVSRAHQDAAYGESALAGRTLAAQSKLPKIVAENLGAGFGQWDFFPEAADVVDFACAYVPPATEEDVWTMARAWAADDAAGKHTVLCLIGREILQHELRRIDVPKLRAVVDETRASRANALRAELGLAVPPAKAEKAETKRRAPAAAKPAAEPKREIPTRMPKPAFVPPPKKAPEPPPKRFGHPKFGEGILERQDGEGPEAKLTIKFDSGSKTLLARYVTEVPT
jgi:hypothetical protein